VPSHLPHGALCAWGEESAREVRPGDALSFPSWGRWIAAVGGETDGESGREAAVDV
jgi:hypothetical protein